MATLSTSSNFSQAHVDFYIRKKLLELGQRKHLWRKFVNKERIEKGNGTAWKALRYVRIDVPLSSLSEGVAPSESDMEIEYLTCTATQYGLTVKLTDILQMTINHPVLQKAIELKADAMATLDDKLIAEKALEMTNVFYGGTATARSGLSASGADVLTTTILRKAIVSLRATDGVKGRSPTNAAGGYVGLIHSKQIFDIQADTEWKNMAYRLDREDMEKGAVAKWMGTTFYETDFLPVFWNLSNAATANNTGFTTFPTIDNNTAVAASRGLNGLKAVSTLNASGSLAINTTYYFIVTARHKKRGFEEGTTAVLRAATANTANHKELVFTMPSSTDYVYSLYFGDTDDRTDCFRVASNQVAGATVSVTTVPTSGTLAPVHAPRLTTSVTSTAADVHPMWILGGDALAVVDLDDLKSYVTRGPDSGNPLDQFVIIGSKFMLGGVILQDSFGARVETQSAFGA